MKSADWLPRGFAAILSCGNLSRRKLYTGGKKQLHADAALVANGNVSRKVKAQRRRAEEALRRRDLPFRRYFKSGGATFSFVLPV